MDCFSKDKRSDIMSKIKAKDTAPEKSVCTLLRKLNCKFTKNNNTLLGNPDIIINNQKKVIFVNGCFWHGHKGCNRYKRPSTNKNFWNTKLDKNIQRDKLIRKRLNIQKYRVLTVWQCETTDEIRLKSRLQKFLKKAQLAK